jgi:photosystem II stability/assembly factor-like uncharacterized protein
MKTILKANITILFSIFFLFIDFVNVNAQDTGKWEILNRGFLGDNFSIDFVSEDVGWLSSSNVLLKTENSGQTWTTLPLDENWIFEKIDFVSFFTGWAIVWDVSLNCHHIVRSDDGGKTWSMGDSTTGTYFYKAEIFAIDDSNVYVANDEGEIYKTADSGISWSDVSPDTLIKEIHSMWFFSEYSGIVSAYYDYGNRSEIIIWKTENGGDSWDVIFPELFKPSKFQFVSDSTAYFLTYQNTDSGDVYSMGRSDDMFNSASILLESENQIDSFFASNSDTIHVLEKQDAFYNPTTGVIFSIDGGLTWGTQNIFENQRYNLIYFVNNYSGYLISKRRLGSWNDPPSGIEVLQTMDRGDSWKIKFLSYPLNDVYFLNKNMGFATAGWSTLHGSSGALFHTVDGGKTWQRQFSHFNNIKSCFFISDNIGFTHNGAGFYKTINAGNSWTEIHYTISDSACAVYEQDICFTDEYNGTLIGYINDCNQGHYYYSVIFLTTDGGFNWSEQWRGPVFDNEYDIIMLNSVYFIDENFGWIVGSSGLVLKYTKGNDWQEVPAFTDLPLRKVYFLDQSHGWISAGYHNRQDSYLKLFKTNDGGETWKKIPDFNYEINDMYFEDSLSGWAVGNDTSYSKYGRMTIGHGVILKTLDGGNNWNVLVEDLAAPLNALHFKDGYGWAVGGNGLVLRTEDGASWVDQNTGKTYPNKFSLSQNYPNPFNPSTKITFVLPKAESVKIEIYNTLGQRVKTILNQHMKAGSHDVEFNGQNLSSGIYYYRIEAGEFQDVKKMILLR